MNKAALVAALGLFASCGGAPPPATTPVAGAVEDFGPGLVSHDVSVEEVTRDVTRVLGASYKIAPGGEAGMVTTEWAVHDAATWPGAETRVKVEVTADKVIVRVQCRTQRESCTRTVPEEVELVALAQSLADQIVTGRVADRILVAFRGFQKDTCACTDAECVAQVDKKMMEWAMKNADSFRDIKPTRAQEDEADRIQEAMDVCKERFEPAKPHWSGKSTGSPECDEYLATFDHVAAECADELGPALDAMKQSREAQEEAFAQWATLDEASKQATIEAAAIGCKSATEALRTSAQSMGCKL